MVPRVLAAVFSFVLLFSISANAESRLGGKDSQSHTRRGSAAGSSGNPTLHPSVSTPASAKNELFRQLLSAETESLSWPAFPRIWIERSIQTFKASNTSLGMNVPVLDSGAKLSIGFRYGLKTTFILISSLRRSDQQVGRGPLDSFSPLAEGTDPKKVEASIVHWDENQKVAFPKIRDGYPMVGFCAFEASLQMDKTGKAELNAIALSQSVEGGETEMIQQILFSNFFQVRSDISIRDYLEDVCGNIFRDQVERSVVDDFSKMVVEKVLLRNPKHQCEPPAAGEDPAALEIGDPSCLEWHNSYYSRAIRKMTVPRCILGRTGAYQCQLRARENKSCSLYMDAKTGKRSETITSRSSVRITGGDFSFPCDRTKGLRCQLTHEPWMFLGEAFLPGSSICVPSR